MAGKRDVREHPRRKRCPKAAELVSLLPLDLCQDLSWRNEATYRAYTAGRLSQRETGDYPGLHHVTISGIVRAKERELRQRDAEGGDDKRR